MTAQGKARKLTLDVLCKYPFLNASMEWIQEKNVIPLDAFYTHVGIMDKIRAILADAMDNKEESKALAHDSDEIIYLYPWLRIILAFMNMPRVTYKIANLLSKHFSAMLAKEDETTLLLVAQDQGINVDRIPDDKAMAISTVSFQFRLPFLDYLQIAAKFKSPAWKLVNRLLKNGSVYLRKQDLARMIEELIKTKISEANPALKDESLKKSFMDDPLLKPFFEGLMNVAKEKTSAGSGSTDSLPVDDSAFPPCINAILDKNSKGINLAHSERLFLVYFLLTIGKTVEEVLDLFRNQPDYNEKISRYQVEFAAGMHGKKTNYKPHNCVTLESINICKKADPEFGSKWCVEPKYPFKNPLTFYRRSSKSRARHLAQNSGTEPSNEDKVEGPSSSQDDGQST
nr:hypothetical protein [Candidatus Sigynarchaeota archaeon]